MNSRITVFVEGLSREYEYDEADINYRITLLSDDVVSIIFEGGYNIKSAAHPTSFFDSVSVEIGSGKAQALSDYYDINDEFVTLVKTSYKEQARDFFSRRLGTPKDNIPADVGNEFDETESSLLLDWLKSADSEHSDIHSFLTENSVGISLPVSHALGDYCEVYLTR